MKIPLLSPAHQALIVAQQRHNLSCRFWILWWSLTASLAGVRQGDWGDLSKNKLNWCLIKNLLPDRGRQGGGRAKCCIKWLVSVYNLVNPNYFSVGQSLRNISSLAGTDKTVGRTVSWLDNLTSIVILIPHWQQYQSTPTTAILFCQL